MARALALGWGEPVLCTDAGSGRARALADEVGRRGRRLQPRARRAGRPGRPRPQAGAARRRGAGDRRGGRRRSSRSSPARRRPSCAPPTRRRRCSASSRTRRWRSAAACSPSPRRTSRSTRSCGRRVRGAVRAGRARWSTVPGAADARRRARRRGVGPAYWALLVEAQVDAAVRRGMPAALAATLVTETMAGTAELLRARDHDTLRAAPRGRVARRHDGARAWRRWSAAACAPPSRRRWTTS